MAKLLKLGLTVPDSYPEGSPVEVVYPSAYYAAARAAGGMVEGKLGAASGGFRPILSKTGTDLLVYGGEVGDPLPPLVEVRVKPRGLGVRGVQWEHSGHPRDTGGGAWDGSRIGAESADRIATAGQVQSLSILLTRGEQQQAQTEQALADIAQQQAANNAATLEAIEQTRSITGIRPLNREPRRAAPDGSYPADPPNTYRVVRASGIVDVVWDGKDITAETPAAVTINQLGRVAVDATYYGVAEGASAQTVIDTIAAAKNGQNIMFPRVTVMHLPNTGLTVAYRKHLTIYGNGLRIEADTTMKDYTGANVSGYPATENAFVGGLKLMFCEYVVWHDTTYDGRLDARTPFGGDTGGSGPKSGWNIHGGIGVELHDCAGLRCMMDGVSIGGVGREFVPPGWTSDPENAYPVNVVLKNFIGEYNYRQGLSVVGVDGLLIDGGRYNYTGKLGPGKGTLPMAGIDFEGHVLLNERNQRVRIINSPEIAYNSGIGLSIHAGTQGLRCESAWTHHNDGPGVQETGAAGTMDNYVNALSEYNCQGSYKVGEVIRAGIRPVHRGIIRAGRGVPGLQVDIPCAAPDVQGVQVIATDPRPGERCGSVLIVTGGESYVDPATGLSLGLDAANQPITIPMPTLGGIISGNTVTDGTWDNDNFAAFQVNVPGSRVIGNEARKTTDAALSSTRGVFVKQAAHASGNSGPGYATPLVSNAPGEHLIPLPAPYFDLTKLDSLTLSDYTASDYGKTVTLLGSDPDVLRYEVTWTAFYPAQDAYREADWLVSPAVAGYAHQVVSVTARSEDGPAAAWRRDGTRDRVSVIVPRVFSKITVTAVMEVRRA